MSTTKTTTEMKIDYSLIPENVPAICIPYVFENIHETRIRGIFKDLEIGDVSTIDLVPYTASDGKRVNRVFIHLKWNTQESTNKVRTKLLCGREIKVIYDDPWFWCVSASRAKAPPREKKASPPLKSRPHIEDDDDDEEQKPRHSSKPRDNIKPRDNRKPPNDVYRKQQQVAPRIPKQRINIDKQEDDDDEKMIPPRIPKQHINIDKHDDDENASVSTMTSTQSSCRKSNTIDVDDLGEMGKFEYSNLPTETTPPLVKKAPRKKKVIKETAADDDGDNSTVVSSITDADADT